MLDVKSNKKWSVQMLAEGGVMIALSTLLSYIKLFKGINGGSVTIGSMVPIMFFAIRWGIIPGISVGAVYGILQCILEPQFYHPIQFLLDYPLAFACLGLAGICKIGKKEVNKRDYILLIIGILLSILGRFTCHLLSGVIFFAEYAGDQNPWIYSTLYNLGYLIPEFIISSVILSFLFKPLNKIIK